MSQSSTGQPISGPGRLAGVLAALAGSLLVAVLLASAAVIGAAGAEAATQTITVDEQASQADTPVNPYSDTDLHVAWDARQQTQHSYIHVKFDSLPKGTTINRLTVALTQSTSTTGNVETQNAGVEACPLTGPLPKPYDSTKAPAWDCSKAAAVGETDGNGGWKFDLQSLVYIWDQSGNTGAALVAIPQPLPVGSTLGPTANNWALAFDAAQTKASADVTPPAGQSPSTTGSTPVEAAAPPPALAGSGLALAPVVARPAPVPPPPPAAPVTPAAGAQPAAAPSAAAPATTSAPAAPVPTATAVPETPSGGVSRGWLVATVLLALAAAGAVATVAVRQFALRGSISVGSFLGSLGAARSKVATPVAVLAVGAVLAAGFAGRQTLASSPAAGPGGTGPVAGLGSDVPAAPSAVPSASAAAPATASAQPGAPAGAAAAGIAAAPGTSAGSGTAGTAGHAGPGASGGAAGSSAPAGQLPRGVTPTTVRIGFFNDTNTNTINQAAGINGLNNLGDPKAQATALVNWINGHGGIAGHQIDPVFVPADASNTDPTYPTQLCHQMVDDEHVFAVVDGNNDTQDALQCYADSHTLLFNEGLQEIDAATIASWSPYFWSPSLPNLDRSTAEELDGLQSKGFFTRQDKVGYLYLDEPATHRTIDRIVTPRLSQMGYPPSSVTSVGIAATGNSAEIESAIQNGMLKMKTSGVTKMFFVNDVGGGLAIFGMRFAENLQYHPTYGLQSLDALDAGAYLEPADQLRNAIGIGYLMWADTSTPNSDGFPASPAEAQCYKIMNGAGIATPNPPGRDGEATAAMAGLCDALFLLYDGAQGLGQSLSAANFGAAAERLGTSYQNSNGYSGNTYIGPGHHDGNDSYRFAHWDPSCTNGYDGGTGKGSNGCFKLDSRTSYRSPEV